MKKIRTFKTDIMFTELNLAYYMVHTVPVFDSTLLIQQIHKYLSPDAEIVYERLLFNDRKCVIRVKFPALCKVHKTIANHVLFTCLSIQNWTFKVDYHIDTKTYTLTYINKPIGSIVRELCSSRYISTFSCQIVEVMSDNVSSHVRVNVIANIAGDIEESGLSCSHYIIGNILVDVTADEKIIVDTEVKCDEYRNHDGKVITNQYMKPIRLCFYCDTKYMQTYYDSFSNGTTIYVTIGDNDKLLCAVASNE